jgi:hypothetical protein
MLLEDFLKQFEGLDPKTTQIKFIRLKYNGDYQLDNTAAFDKVFIPKNCINADTIDYWMYRSDWLCDTEIVVLK